MKLARDFTSEPIESTKLALQWRIPLSVKPTVETALSQCDYQKLYNYTDVANAMAKDKVWLVGQLS